MTPKEAIMKSERGGIIEFEDDAERILRRLERAGFEVVPRLTLSKRPVAFRVQIGDEGGWQLFKDEAEANHAAELCGNSVQGLYARDGTPNVLRQNQDAIIDRLLTAGNHIATYRSERWPDYPLEGLTRNQQCELALRTLGAGRDYDMWCCWSAMMQARDELDAF